MPSPRHPRSRSTPRGTEIHGVRVCLDGKHKTLYYPCDETASRSDRFAAFQRRMLTREGPPVPAAAFALACVIAFDAPGLDALDAMYGAIQRPYRVKDRIAVEWARTTGVVDRRLLSSYTALALHEPAQAPWPAFAEVLPEVLALAQVASLPELQALAGSWLLGHAPGWLLPRMLGAARSASLPRSALARWTTGLVPALGEELSSLSSGELELLDGCVAEGEDCDESLFNDIVKACADDGHSAHHTQRDLMQLALTALIPRALREGPISCLMLRFARQLVEVGTPGYGVLAPGSLEEYLRLTVTQAWRHLRDALASTLDSARLETYYRGVIGAAKTGQASKAIAACKAFHAFLLESFEVGPWPLKDVAAEPSKPDAQAVFPDERERIWQRLDTGDWSDPLRWRTLVLFAIFCSSPRRRQDGTLVRVGGIREFEGQVILDIDPNPLLDPKMKNEARVSVEVSDSRCIRILLAAQNLRRAEGAQDDDKLLGSIATPRTAWRYLSCHKIVNQLCKWATGEPSCDAHSLRHSHLTERLIERDVPQRELDQLSADAGHVGDTTILDDYGHAFEFAARRALDTQLLRFELTSDQVAAWSGVKAPSVRKAWSRSAHARAETTQQILQAAVLRLAVEDVTQGFVMGEPGELALPWARTVAPPVSPELALTVLQDLDLEGGALDPEQVAWRRTTSLETVNAIASAVIQLFAPRAWDRARFETPSVPEALARAPMAIDLQRSNQPKCTRLRHRLARLTPEARHDLTAAWLRVARGDGYVLADLADALPLIKVFRDAGISPGQMVLAHDGSNPAIQALVGRLTALLGGAPTVVHLRPRRGRAPTYLQVTEPDKSGRASRSVHGLNAVLLSAAIAQAVTEARRG